MEYMLKDGWQMLLKRIPLIEIDNFIADNSSQLINAKKDAEYL